MGAAVVGMVDDHPVARREPPVQLERCPQCELHQPELGRDLLGVGDHPTLRVEEAARELEHLADDRREGRAIFDDRHLLGDPVEGVAEDLEGDRVQLLHVPLRLRSSSTFPAAPTTRRQRRGRSTSSRPARQWPARRSPLRGAGPARERRDARGLAARCRRAATRAASLPRPRCPRPVAGRAPLLSPAREA